MCSWVTNGAAAAAGESGGLRPAPLAPERRFAEFNLVQVNGMIKNKP